MIWKKISLSHLHTNTLILIRRIQLTEQLLPRDRSVSRWLILYFPQNNSQTHLMFMFSMSGTQSLNYFFRSGIRTQLVYSGLQIREIDYNIIYIMYIDLICILYACIDIYCASTACYILSISSSTVFVWFLSYKFYTQDLLFRYNLKTWFLIYLLLYR